MPNYPNTTTAIHAIFENWCQENGYTELFRHLGQWWAFPPNGVIPVRVYKVLTQGKTRYQCVRSGQTIIKLLPDGKLERTKVLTTK